MHRVVMLVLFAHEKHHPRIEVLFFLPLSHAPRVLSRIAAQSAKMFTMQKAMDEVLLFTLAERENKTQRKNEQTSWVNVFDVIANGRMFAKGGRKTVIPNAEQRERSSCHRKICFKVNESRAMLRHVFCTLY